MNLTEDETLVFKAAVEEMLRANSISMTVSMVDRFRSELDIPDLTDQEFDDILTVLENRNLVTIKRVTQNRIYTFDITSYGFDLYGRIYMEGYEELREAVLRFSDTDAQPSIEDLSQSINQSIGMTNAFLQVLKSEGYINIAEVNSPHATTFILGLTPEGRRLLKKR